ncbi:TVP38/TMEM64 family protein [Embleya sp. NPDC005575]|uniref:TVP38/TMEM64 family protein n=1 Tax=Embleya sp. NPDC005575 TaxID=3156892 RepID=UPI0033B14850
MRAGGMGVIGACRRDGVADDAEWIARTPGSGALGAHTIMGTRGGRRLDTVRGLLDSLRDFLDHGAWTHWPLPVSVAIFIVVCALSVVALVPKSLFAPVAGALFGAIGGTMVTLAGATLGAMISLYLGRRMGRERISGWLHKREALAVLDRRLSRNGLVPITILRMIPVIPSSVVSYGAAATGIRTGHFLLGTALGMLPMTMVQCAAGASVRSGLSTPVVVGVFVGCVSLALAMVVVRRRGEASAPATSEAAVTSQSSVAPNAAATAKAPDAAAE